MAFAHGSKAQFTVDDSGGTPRDITTYLTNVEFPREADTAEVTTMGDSDKEYLPGLRGATISVEGKLDPTVDGYLAGILGGVAAAPYTSSFSYKPQGSATPTYTGECIETSYEPATPVDDAGTFSAEFIISGAVARA